MYTISVAKIITLLIWNLNLNMKTISGYYNHYHYPNNNFQWILLRISSKLFQKYQIDLVQSKKEFRNLFSINYYSHKLQQIFRDLNILNKLWENNVYSKVLRKYNKFQ